MEILVQPSSDAATELAAQIMAKEIRANARPKLGLATGRTMEAVYARLVQMHQHEGLDFSACRTFNLDEYVGLPGDHKNSYRYYMNEHLFRRVNIELRNTHLPDGTAPNLDGECQNYERLIEATGGIDLQLLGIGQSGHIGFNEPLSPFRSRTRVVRLAASTILQNSPLFGAADQMPHRAITMGVETILNSRRCLLLATGEAKAEIIAQAIEGPMTSMVSASALQLHPHCTVVLDEAAARRLTKADCFRTSCWTDFHDESFRTSSSAAIGSAR